MNAQHTHDAAPAIRCEGVAKRYAQTPALRDFDLEVRRGELLALVGPSGCGKTTALRTIAGFERPDAGSVWIADRVVAGPDTFIAAEKRRVGMVFQDYALFPHLSVRRNVAFGLSRRPGSGRRERIAEILAAFELDGLQDRYPHQLSGGQQQRVALARALAPDPEVVLLDEPLSSLDVSLRRSVRGEIQLMLRRLGTTAVIVTHDQEEALSMSDRVAVMLEGRVIQCAAPAAVYEQPVDVRMAQLIGEGNLLPARREPAGARCELGLVRLRDESPGAGPAVTSGEGTVFIRPETIELVDPSQGAAGQVLTREFYGHDQALIVELDSGARVRVRLPAGPRTQIGERVGLSVTEPACWFPGA